MNTLSINSSNKTVKVHGEWLTMNNYKEPLKKIERGSGYGFYGTVLVTTDGEKIQCHMCGKMFESLYGHIQHHHKITQREYKKKYEISPSTALLSETQRQRQKEGMLSVIKNMSEEERAAFKERTRERMKRERQKRSPLQPKITLETKNKRGTCPDQLLDKIKKVKEAIGHTPSLAEFINETGTQRYKHLIFTTFGSWKKALEILGEEPKKNIGNKGKGKKRYDAEYLLEMLTVYAQENRKIPTHTDSKRGIIPDYKIYERFFGTFENARRLANVYDYIDDDYLEKFKTRSHKKKRI